MDLNAKLATLHGLLESVLNREDLMFPKVDTDFQRYFDTNIINQETVTDDVKTFREIDEMLCELFITDSGSPNLENINAFRQYGYEIYCGERDSFGWLTACCQKMSIEFANRNPIFVFG